MLNFKQKLKILKGILQEKEISYADSFNTEILIAIEGFENNNFLKDVNGEEAIKNWLNKLRSRIVMHEDDEAVREIIDDYINNG